MNIRMLMMPRRHIVHNSRWYKIITPNSQKATRRQEGSARTGMCVYVCVYISSYMDGCVHIPYNTVYDFQTKIVVTNVLIYKILTWLSRDITSLSRDKSHGPVTWYHAHLSRDEDVTSRDNVDGESRQNILKVCLLGNRWCWVCLWNVGVYCDAVHR